MPTPQHVGQPPRVLARLLSLMVVIQCAGLLVHVLRDTTAVGAILFVHLRVAEKWTLFVDQGAAIVAFSISLAALRGGAGRGMLFVGGWFTLIAGAQVYDGGEPFSQWTLAAHATRLALPFAAYAAPRVGSVPWLGADTFRWGLRVATALTFTAHGYASLSGHPHFIDYVLTADRKFGFLGLTELGALDIMQVIGLIDLTIALLVVTGRDFHSVLLYAAGWGLITALARIVHMDVHYPQALLRVANAAIPLALLMSRDECFERHDARPGGNVLSALRPQLSALALLAAGGALLFSLTSAPSGAADIAPTQLRVIWLENPSSEATVAWSTDLAGSTHEIFFDTQPRGGVSQAYRFSAKAKLSAQYASSSRFYHHAALAGLSPSTTYHFIVVSDGTPSREHHFVTAPRDDRELKLLYGGDSRSDRTNRQKVNDLIRKQVEADSDILAFAHGGDYVEDGTSFSQWNDWLDDFQRTVTAAGRILPLIPARGNHEASGPLFGEVFAFPGGDVDSYYVSEISPQIAFIVLNTNASLAGNQRTFLDNELARRSLDTRWLLASYHQPAYSAVKSPGGALVHWVPLFEQYNVDLVCESDGHVLKRTFPMRNGKQAEDGVVYIGEGGLGVAQRTSNGAPYLAMSRSAHHIQLLTFRPDRLHYEAITLDGVTADSIDRLPRRVGKQLPAKLISATALSSTSTMVRFDKPLDMQFAFQADRYTLSPTGSVLSASAGDEKTAVLLTTSALAPGQYILAVDGLIDFDGLSVNASIPLLVTDQVDGPDTVDDALCPPGAGKVSSGQCGCDVADTDTDADGVADCIDGCPDDASKTWPLACGCGVPEGTCIGADGGMIDSELVSRGCSAGALHAAARPPVFVTLWMVLGLCLTRRRRSS